MTLHVYSAPLRYDGDDRLDISRWGNHPVGRLFAPSEMLLLGYKRLQKKFLGSEIMRRKFEMYSDCYRIELRIREKHYPDMWRKLLELETVTLCCYCRSPTMCHRGVCARLLVDKGAIYEGER